MNLIFYKQTLNMLNRSTVLLRPHKEPVYFTNKDFIAHYIYKPMLTSNNLYMFLWNPDSKEYINDLASELRGFKMRGNVIVENSLIYLENRIIDPYFPY